MPPFVRQNPAMAYIRQIPATLIEAALLMVGVWLGCMAILYTGAMLWHIYRETPMGQQFLALFPGHAAAISEVMGCDLFCFAGRLTLTAFAICIAIAAGCRFFYIRRLLYDSMGLAGKLFVWGVPLTAGVTYTIYQETDLGNWQVLAVFATFPTYCLFMNCFRYTAALVPEAGFLLSQAWRGFARLWQHVTGRPVPELTPLLKWMPFKSPERAATADPITYKFSLKGWVIAKYQAIRNELREEKK
ncbi:MAG: hypothetical protein ACQERN_06240 [Thermodesulfobacteriota bacterium]